jgi:uncharacterized membrane protein YbhN (UPF0104 family)
VTTRRALTVGLALAIVVGALYGLVHAVTGNWHEVRGALSHANWLLLLTGFAVALIVVPLLAQRWNATMRALGADVTVSQSAGWFATGQLGKYAPGGVWHIVGQGELAARGGIGRAVAYSSVVLSTITLVAGAAVTVAIGGVLPGVDGVRWWAVAAGIGALLVLLEPHLRRLLLSKIRIDAHAVSARQLLRLVVGCIPVWVLIGTSTWLTARAFGPGLGVLRTMVGAVGSWLVGIVTLPAPGGIGVREAVFAAVVRRDLGSTTAALVALVSRLSFLLADVTCFAIARLSRVRRASSH